MALAIVFINTGLLTQPLPNFSGTWVPIPGRAQPSFLPAGAGLTIRQDSKTIVVQQEEGLARTYRLDSEPTQHEEKESDVTHTVTARASWVGTKLTITEARQGWKRERTYFFDNGLQTELSITSATTLLHTRNGALTVSTIGPSTRVYRKGTAQF